MNFLNVSPTLESAVTINVFIIMEWHTINTCLMKTCTVETLFSITVEDTY